MQPVGPGWFVSVVTRVVDLGDNGKHEVRSTFPIVGWEGREPVIALDAGVRPYREEFGEDPYRVVLESDD